MQFLTTKHTQLKTLSLASTKVTTNTLTLVADNLRDLEFLSVEFCKIDDLSALSRCEKLRFLHCGTPSLTQGKILLWRQENTRVKVGTVSRVGLQKTPLETFCEL